MPDEQSAPDPQLVAVGGLLFRQIMDVKTIGETLRLLLIERGVFSDAEYLAKYSHAESLLRQDLQQKATSAVELQALNLLLQAQKGIVQ